jgi:hypothetical protein
LVVAKRRDAEREDYGESKKNGLLFNSKMWLKFAYFFMFEKQNIKTQAG